MRSSRTVALFLAVSLVAAALAVPAMAQADKRIEAATRDRYTASEYTMDQGERLTFFNGDLSGDRHDVVANKNGSDGRPIFRSEIIGQGQESFVEGSQYLTTGSYDFFCSIHPFMQAKLNVTSAGAPVPRPGSEPPPGGVPTDQVPPSLEVTLRRASLDSVLDRKRLVAKVKVDEGAEITLKATTKHGGRNVTIAKVTTEFEGAETANVVLKLTARGRSILRNRSRAAIKLTAKAEDSAGNDSQTERASRTYK